MLGFLVTSLVGLVVVLGLIFFAAYKISAERFSVGAWFGKIRIGIDITSPKSRELSGMPDDNRLDP